MGSTIRVLHFSDLHIGVERYGTIDPSTGFSTRLGDFLAAFDELVDFAVGNQVDLVVFSGDAYKNRDPSQTHQREFARRIHRLVEAKIPVFLLVGNHDMPQMAYRATALEIFPTLSVPNVFIGSQLGTIIIETNKGPVQILSLPWTTRGNLLTKEEGQNRTIKEINQDLESTLTQWLSYEAERLDPAMPAILSAHVSIANAKLSSERTMLLGRDYMLMQSSLAHPAVDYVALGHIHRHQELSHHRPPIVYSGSLQRVDFGEEEEDEKGFYVVDLDPSLPQGERCAKFEFHPVRARRFLTIRVEVGENESDPTRAVVNAISSYHVEDVIVRVHIQVPQSLEAGIRMEDVRKALDPAHFVSSVTKEVPRAPTVRLGGRSPESLSPADALQLYLENKDTNPERMEKLKKYGAKVINDSMAQD